MKKNLFMVATVLFTSILFATNLFAATKFGKVTDINNTDSAIKTEQPTIIGNETANVTIKYDAATLKILAGNGERPDNYAWLGFHIDKPTEVSGTPKYKVGSEDPEEYTDGDYYFGIDEAKLLAAAKTGKNVEYTYEFDWNGDGSYEQTVTAVVVPSKITLNNKTGETIWTPAEALENAPVETAPKTGDTLPTALIGLVSLVVGSGVYTLKLFRI